MAQLLPEHYLYHYVWLQPSLGFWMGGDVRSIVYVHTNPRPLLLGVRSCRDGFGLLLREFFSHNYIYIDPGVDRLDLVHLRELGYWITASG